MRAGQLRHRVQLQSKAKTPDGAGGNAVAWNTYATVWGNVVPKNVSEGMEEQRVRAKTQYTLTLRYMTGITAEHRVLYDGRAMQIRGIQNKDERKRELTLDLEDGVAL